MAIWHRIEPKPQDKIKLRCDRSANDMVFREGSVYDGCWPRYTDGEGHEKVRNYWIPFDENGESFNTYRSPWFEFTIVEGLTEPPKE